MNILINYLFFMITGFVISKFVKKRNTKKDIILILTISILLGLFSVLIGVDKYMHDRYNYYFHYLNTYKSMTFKAVFSYPVELGYVIINYLFVKISSSTNFMFFIYMFIPTFIILLFLYQFEGDFSFYFFLYMTSFLPLFSTYLSRQMFAAGFFMIALYNLFKNNKVMYFIMIILASSFHATAIIGILIYPFFLLINTKVRFLALILFMLVVFFLLEDLGIPF